MANQASPGYGDGEIPEATPEVLLGEPLRECMVEMVDECLRYKADGIDAENYFANVLEPLFRAIASDCIENQPEDTVEFLHDWVGDKMKAGSSTLPKELLAPLPHLKAWCDRQMSVKLKHKSVVESLHAQVASLQRQLAMLREGLGRTAAGQQMFAAAGRGDQAAFEQALATVLYSDGEPTLEESMGPSALEAETAETMGEVLRALRFKGLMSASAAFQHLQPGEDGCISAANFLKEINSFSNPQISPRRSNRLVSNLDRQGIGRIEYKDFRSKISSFLATSREFHPSLSRDELDAIMTRIQMKLQDQGRTVGDAFAEWDSNGSGTLECSEFMTGLRSLHLNLSGKEVAQVYNAMADADANNHGCVNLKSFEAAVSRGAKQNRLKDWALMSFARLRETIEFRATDRQLRHYAERPNCQYMHYSGFTAFAADTEPAFSSMEIGKLWCVLDKEENVEEPAVSIEELQRWMAPPPRSNSMVGKANNSLTNSHSSVDTQASGANYGE